MRAALAQSGFEFPHNRRITVNLAPADLQWSLYGVPEQLENNDTQEAYWEMQKFLVLALKAILAACEDAGIDPSTKYRCPWIEGYCSKTSVRAGEKTIRSFKDAFLNFFWLFRKRFGWVRGPG